ncbi:MAG: hypothetical protein KAS99_04855 [Candidatus Omnitrophica bacterium]|nr:hypothetical protein [Candidatus Omnitrophota bacterium]
MKKGVILVTVIGILVVVTFLALATISMMLQQARISEHKIKRMKAISAAETGMIYAMEKLRKDEITPPATITLPDKINKYTVTVEIIARGTGDCPATAPSDYCLKATAQ